MTATSTPSSYRSGATDASYGRQGSVFAGTILATVGLVQVFEGLSAVLKDDVYVTTRDYVYQFDLTTWGWVHLIIGALVLAVGVAVLAGQRWALVVGIILASLSLLAQFLFMPWQPLWALTVIGINVAVIWALGNRINDA
jgi:hypothetical protein